MHLLRTAAVNASFLAFRSLSTTISAPVISGTTTPLSLLSFLRAAPSAELSTALSTTRTRFLDIFPSISTALSSPAASPYPWRLLAAFAPEKVVSDLVEAVIAAVWVDSEGDFEACEEVVRKLGILTFVEGRARAGGRGLWHPKEEIGSVAQGRRVEYEVEVEGGKYKCTLHLSKHPLCTVRGSNRLEAETAAAEMGIRILRGKSGRSGTSGKEQGGAGWGGGGEGEGNGGVEMDTVGGAEEGGEEERGAEEGGDGEEEGGDGDGDDDVGMGDAEEGGDDGVLLEDVEMS